MYPKGQGRDDMFHLFFDPFHPPLPSSHPQITLIPGRVKFQLIFFRPWRGRGGQVGICEAYQVINIQDTTTGREKIVETSPECQVSSVKLVFCFPCPTFNS